MGTSSHASDAAVRWGFVIGVGAMIVVTLVLAATGVVRTLVIGHDKRVSTSKTIATTWTMLVVAALIAIVYADLLNHPQALNATNDSGIVGQYALLFGGPLGAAILAKGIVTKQVADNPSVKPPASSTSAIDLVADDAGNTDLGDLQYVLFNAVAMFFVIGMLLHAPSKGLPHIPDVLLGLTSVSAVGFVGKKALPPTAPTSAVLSPAHGSADQQIEITLKGLQPPHQKDARMWVRFDDLDGDIVPADVANGKTTLKAVPRALGSPPSKPVKVAVVTAGGIVIDAGMFTYD